MERLQLAKTYFATWTEKNRFSQQPTQKHVWFIQLLHVACWCMIGFEVWASSVQCSSWQLRECTVIVCKVLQRTVACGPGTIYCRYRGPSKPTLATIFAVFFLLWQGQVQNPEWRLVKGVRGIGPFLSQVFNCHIDLFDHGRVNTTSNHSGCLSFSRNHLFRMTTVNILTYVNIISSCSTLQGSWRQLWFSGGWFLGPNTPSECMGLVLATILASALRTFAPWSCAASTCVSQSAPGCGVSCHPHVIRMWPIYIYPYCIHVYHVLVTTATLAVRL